MATGNPRWGYTRIQGALANLGCAIGRDTIKRLLTENEIDPAGCRSMTWKTFLGAHLGAIAATDFFTVEVVTWKGLVREYVDHYHAERNHQGIGNELIECRERLRGVLRYYRRAA